MQSGITSSSMMDHSHSLHDNNIKTNRNINQRMMSALVSANAILLEKKQFLQRQMILDQQQQQKLQLSSSTSLTSSIDSQANSVNSVNVAVISSAYSYNIPKDDAGAEQQDILTNCITINTSNIKQNNNQDILNINSTNYLATACAAGENQDISAKALVRDALFFLSFAHAGDFSPVLKWLLACQPFIAAYVGELSNEPSSTTSGLRTTTATATATSYIKTVLQMCDPKTGKSLVHLACEYGLISELQVFLQFHADINVADTLHGNSPLHTVAYRLVQLDRQMQLLQRKVVHSRVSSRTDSRTDTTSSVRSYHNTYIDLIVFDIFVIVVVFVCDLYVVAIYHKH
jgi:hypothetical protein